MNGETTRQVRGSSLLLAGRMLSLGANFVIQVLIVRYLSKSEYGAFAYAVSIATLAQYAVTLGLDRAVARFLPIYDEHGDHDRLVGTIVLVVTTIIGLGIALVVGVIVLHGWISGTGVADPASLGLLTILILLAPIQSLDDVEIGLFAVFAEPRSIFVRRYVLTPALRVLVVALLIATGGDVTFLAGGYVIAAATGVLIYAVVLWRLLRRRGLIVPGRWRSMRMPARDVFRFALPLLSTDILYAFLGTSDVILLGHFRGPDSVASLRAIQPLAQLNQVVLSSFTLLYTPLASRLFTRGDRQGLRDLYWQTAIWMAVLSFPVFAATTSLAGPLSVGLFGVEYQDSAILLALLSTGYYFQAALGFNGLTIKVTGHVRAAVAIDLLAAATNVAVNLLLIPPYGALGAAIGTTTTLIVHNILKQIGLRMTTGVDLFDRDGLPVFAGIAATAGALWAVAVLVKPPLIVDLALIGVASGIVLGLNRNRLQMAETFPEILRLPIARRLLT